MSWVVLGVISYLAVGAFITFLCARFGGLKEENGPILLYGWPIALVGIPLMMLSNACSVLAQHLVRASRRSA